MRTRRRKQTKGLAGSITRRKATLAKIDQSIADLTRLIELTPGTRKFSYKIRLAQLMVIRKRVKAAGRRRKTFDGNSFNGEGYVYFVSGGAPGSAR